MGACTDLGGRVKLPAEREVLLNIDTVRPENSLWSNLFAPEEVWSGYAGIRMGDMKLLLGDPGFPRAQCPATYRKILCGRTFLRQRRSGPATRASAWEIFWIVAV